MMAHFIIGQVVQRIAVKPVTQAFVRSLIAPGSN